MTTLAGKTAVILGASGSANFGSAIARRLAAEGANVVVAARRREPLEQLASELGGIAVACDVTREGDIEALFVELGAEVSEREGSRVAVVLFEEVRVFHRPHPSPNTDKGAIASIRKWLEQHGVEP